MSVVVIYDISATCLICNANFEAYMKDVDVMLRNLDEFKSAHAHEEKEG